MRSLLGIVAALSLAEFAFAQASRPIRNGAVPSVSPDGKRVAFVSNRDGRSDIYVVDADGSNLRRLTNSAEEKGEPRWSADGRVVYVVSANDTARLHALRPEGDGASIVATIAGTGDIIPSATGNTVLYLKGPWPRQVLMESNLDGSSARLAFADTSGIVASVSRSPDGRHVFFMRIDTIARKRTLFVAEPNGSNARQLADIPATEGTPEWPAWSADSRRIAVQVGRYGRTTPGGPTAHVWVLDLNGSATKLARHDAAYLDETPSWFPDGKRLAIQSNRTGRMEVWIISVDGAEARQLTR